MNREELIALLDDGRISGRKIALQVFYDLESRTCGNCKYKNLEDTGSSRGIVQNCKLGVSFYVDYDYNEEHCEDTDGCNKFERKKDD